LTINITEICGRTFFVPTGTTVFFYVGQVYFMERAKAAGVKEQKEEEEEMGPSPPHVTRLVHWLVVWNILEP
jgi:hypothetical protein